LLISVVDVSHGTKFILMCKVGFTDPRKLF